MSSNPTAKNCMWFKQECCALSSTTLVWTQAEVTMTSMGSRERCSKPHAIRTGITLHSCLDCMRFFAVWFEPTTKVSILGTGAFARVLVQILGISASLLLSYVFVFYVLKNRVSAYWCVCICPHPHLYDLTVPNHMTSHTPLSAMEPFKLLRLMLQRLWKGSCTTFCQFQCDLHRLLKLAVQVSLMCSFEIVLK